ncbi:MAG: hypothetical protein II794_06680 [Oscillospiraceae bacterium]|nr:hypothetical protein [Oscillospiraceae bacterium]
MDRKIKVLLADLPDDDCRALADHLRTRDSIGELRVVENGRSALELICRDRPDVVLIGTFLPGMDFGEVIEKALQGSRSEAPIFVVLSGLPTMLAAAAARKCGASYVFEKPCSPILVGRRIEQLYNCASQPCLELIDPFQEVTMIFADMGIPANLDGYLYLREAVLYSIKEGGLPKPVSRRLYPYIAEVKSATPAKVERSMRHAIEICWNRADFALAKEIFGSSISQDRGKPTNSEFIALVSEYIYIRMGHKNNRFAK